MAYYNNNNNNDDNKKWIPYLLIFLGITTGLGLLIPAGVIWLVLNKSKKDDSTYYRRSNDRSYRDSSYSSAERTKTIKYSNEQMKAINRRLREYFEEHGELPVMKDINLRLKNNEYLSLNSLNVFKNNNYICSLSEFGYHYPSTYNKILRLLLSFANDVNYESEEKPETRKETKPEVKPTVQEETSRAKGFVETIDQLNTAIPDEEITNGLYETSALLKQIGIVEEKFPDSKNKLEKLYEYYLPILIKILNQYKNLQNTNSPQLPETKDKLNKSIVLINDAMKTITATLTEDDVLNLNADISTLEAVLKKDGLAGSGVMKGVK